MQDEIEPMRGQIELSIRKLRKLELNFVEFF